MSSQEAKRSQEYQISAQRFSPLQTPVEAAAYIRSTPATLASWRSRNEGPPFVRRGARVFYRTADLDAWIEAGLVRPPPQNGEDS